MYNMQVTLALVAITLLHFEVSDVFSRVAVPPSSLATRSLELIVK